VDVQEAPLAHYQGDVFRVANPPGEWSINATLSDPEDREEAYQFLRGTRLTPRTLTELLRTPFQRRSAQKPFGESRFSDGSFPVFYSAVERETAAREKAYHVGKDYDETRSAATQYYYRVFRVGVRADLRDLRAKLFDWPWLIDKDRYDRCQRLGKQASDQDAFGFLTPSARRTNGVNAPLFRSDAIQDGTAVEVGLYVFRVGIAGGTITIDDDFRSV
jgi:RES domain